MPVVQPTPKSLPPRIDKGSIDDLCRQTSEENDRRIEEWIERVPQLGGLLAAGKLSGNQTVQQYPSQIRRFIVLFTAFLLLITLFLILVYYFFWQGASIDRSSPNKTITGRIFASESSSIDCFPNCSTLF